MAHALTARLLFDAFARAPALDRKRILAAEIFCKLMQAVEDFGAFSLFCLSEQQNDISTYFNVSTKRIVKFYGDCRNGLADREIDRIYGIPTSDGLIAAGLIKESEGFHCEEGHAKFRQAAHDHYRKLGALFAKVNTNTGAHDHSDIVNMYFNTKHGVRVFLPTAAQANEMSLSDEKVPILMVLLGIVWKSTSMAPVEVVT